MSAADHCEIVAADQRFLKFTIGHRHGAQVLFEQQTFSPRSDEKERSFQLWEGEECLTPDGVIGILTRKVNDEIRGLHC